MPRPPGLNNIQGTGQGTLPLVVVAAGILGDHAGRVLIAKRPAGGHAEGFWEFPGGKLKAGEGAPAALRRELAEELGIAVEEARPFMHYQHAYPERLVELHVFVVDRYSGEPRGMEGQPLRWVPIDQLADANLLPADLPIATAIAAREDTGLQAW